MSENLGYESSSGRVIFALSNRKIEINFKNPNIMTLLIAVLIIHTNPISWWWYPFAFFIWLWSLGSINNVVKSWLKDLLESINQDAKGRTHGDN